MANGANEEYVIDVTVNATDNTAVGIESAEKRVSAFDTKMRHEVADNPLQMTLKIVDRASSVIDQVTRRGMSLARMPFTATLRVADFATAPIRKVLGLLSDYRFYMAAMVTGAAGYGAVVKPIELADNLTSATLGFQAMMGSASKAQQFVKQLQDFGRVTPFTTNDLITNSQLMMNSGFTSKQIIPLLTSFGDAVSGTGGDVNKINNVILALTQMKNHGVVDAQDMLQMTSANIPAWQILAQQMHMSVAQVQKQSQKGTLDANKAIALMAKGLEERFGGSMQKNANLTVKGILSQYKDAFTQYLATPWGQGLQKGLLPELNKFNDWIGKNQRLMDQWGNDLKRWGTEGAQWLTNKVQNLITTLQNLTHSQDWTNAPTFWDKMKVGWHDLVVTPFNSWWSGSGRQEVASVAASVGGFFGDALHGMVMAAFGLVSAPSAVNLPPAQQRLILKQSPEMQKALKDAASQNDFVNAGQTAGTAFFNAFMKSFDAKQLAQKAAQAFGDIQPWHAQTPGGAAVRTGIDIGVGAWLWSKVVRPVLNTGSDIYKGGKTAVSKILPKAGASAADAAGASAADAGAGAVARLGLGRFFWPLAISQAYNALVRHMDPQLYDALNGNGQPLTPSTPKPKFTPSTFGSPTQTPTSWVAKQTPNTPKTTTVQVNMGGVNIPITMTSGDPNQVLRVIRSNLQQIADEVMGEMGVSMERAHGNMPVMTPN